ncbi:hypothetical protein ISF_07397 [Cordyceps fumosorosea ARSEF 2679]|uniref:Nephrocystin 3-like N-terminal domain-containing protein n=1 Tax=Cordyceps fumosorosea (strain ARSEF 2679) TaxID=1081104 RepID=A0A167PP91_CORFA|nr:hypothetical protein ISF_07397 [Cordyceps fumosorosea ARSEF 2679]OAA56881.1 hypothetical protein ISF_07397 [Cordyceps fumosorosea ARSEF 2679]
MSDKKVAAQRSSARGPCREFIRTHLPKNHEAFSNSHVEFDTTVQQYVPFVKGDGTSQNEENSNQHQRLDLLPKDSTSDESNPSRRPFWDEMFPEAMSQLRDSCEEPPKLVDTDSSIRVASGWPEIVTTVELARAKYYNYKGFIGFWKKTRHGLTDDATDAKRLFSLLPDSDYTSVIHCVFDIIADAAKRASQLRKEVEDTLRQMRQKLSDVERVVAVYAGEDEDIVSAAMDVLVSSLQALEGIVLYYSEKRGLKVAASAMWQGGRYKDDFSTCLAGIDSSSRRLIEVTHLAHIQATQSINIKTSEGLEKLGQLQRHHLDMAQQQKRLADRQSELASSGRKIARRQGKLAAELSREVAANELNARANSRNAATSAVAVTGIYLLIQDRHKFERALEREKRRNARLIVELRASEARSRSVSRGRYSLPARGISSDELLGILNLSSSGEEADMATISDSAVLVDRRDQGRAEQLVNNPQFRQWMVQLCSTELLVHGHMRRSRSSITALSLFSAAIVQCLRRDVRFCTLAFFCGQHKDASDQLTGGVGLIKALTLQLLAQYRFTAEDLSFATQDMDLDALEDGQILPICRLFTSLIRCVRNITIFCVLDSVEVYEEPKFLQGMALERALFDILSLTSDDKVKTDVKVLMMSPTATTTILKAFNENDVVSMVGHGQPKGQKNFDEGRLGERLGEVSDC